MLMRGQLTLFHVRGIRIGVDYSWFFVLFLVIIWLSGFYRDVSAPTTRHRPYVLAVASALALLRLDPAARARPRLRRGPQGIGISEITLWMFGGVARMKRERTRRGPSSRSRSRARGDAGDRVVCVAVGVALAGAASSGTRCSSPTARAPPARSRCSPGWRHQPPRPRLQPDSGLPARRRADRPRDRLADHRRPQPGDALRGRRSDRGSPTCSSASGILLVYQGDAIGGIWLA